MFGRSLIVALATLVGMAGATPAALGKTVIGSTTVVVEKVLATFNQTEVRQLVLDAEVYANEVVETESDSATEIVFLDETKLVLGPNSRLTLDSVVFDPDAAQSQFVVTATAGVVKFLSGTSAKSAYSITTPVSTIGIRGTFLFLLVLPDGTTMIATIAGLVEVINCDGIPVLLRPGQATTIRARPEGGCDAPTEPGGVPAPLEQAVALTDLLLLNVEPGAGGGPRTGFTPLTPVRSTAENAAQDVASPTAP